MQENQPKIRVGVLMGGRSIEREVSFNSGRTVCDHIDVSRFEVIPLFQKMTGELYVLPWYFLHRGKISDFVDRLDQEAQKISWDYLKNNIDFIYIAMHGRYAEDGTLQGALEVLGIPYTGAKVLGSAFGMNKAVQKEILKMHGIEVPRGCVFTAGQVEYLVHHTNPLFVRSIGQQTITLEEILMHLSSQGVSFPFIVKPVLEGSSLGVSVVQTESELLPALLKAAYCDPHCVQAVLVEEKIEGMEFTFVGIQDYRLESDEAWIAFPLTEVVIEAGTAFYDYEQKYMRGRAQKITPARCDQEYKEKIAHICIRAARALEFKTMMRIDGFLTIDGRVVIIDPNSLSGFGPTSFVFDQAAQAGMNHTQFINYLIDTELAQLKRYSMMVPTRRGGEMSQHKVRTRVAVLLGGDSNERETSLESGRNVCYKLSPEKYEAIPVFVTDTMELYTLPPHVLIKHATYEIVHLLEEKNKVLWSDLPERYDFVFIALHGGKGENGSVQGFLEMLGMAYNGSGVLPSALCMDKYKTNTYLKNQGFAVPKNVFITDRMWQDIVKQDEPIRLIETIIAESFGGYIQFPLIVKPHDDGCSVMVGRVHTCGEMMNALRDIFEADKTGVLIEECISGMELTVGVMGNEHVVVLPASLAVASGNGILSMEDKFLPGQGENRTPAPLNEYEQALVQYTMSEAYKVLGCRGYVRIDCFYQSRSISPTGEDRVVILEVNTLPGLTPATCLFHQAAEIGMKPMEFIDKIIQLGMQNHKKMQVLVKNEEDIPKEHESLKFSA